VLAAGVVTAADAGAPALEISWSVDGGPVNQEFPIGEAAGDGSFTFQGAIIDFGTGLELNYDIAGDLSANLSGNVSVLNDMSAPIDVFVEIILPSSAPLPDGSLMAALGVVGLTTGVEGGQITGGAPALWQTLVDGAVLGPATSLFFDPFYVAHSGPASSSVSADYGNPEPVPGPAIKSSIGFELNFSVTEFDRAAVTSAITTAGGLATCEGDLDGDGVVGTGDVADLLSVWGPCPGGGVPCPGDLDGDGEVGIADFLNLLARWGPCL
jgi:hypothetical protein